MADFYKILKADPLGEPWTPNAPNAKPIQTYWCQVEGVDEPVSIGKQVGNSLLPGQHIYGDLVFAKSQKGNQYWKLKSARIPDGVQRPADTPAQAVAQESVGANVSASEPAWFTVYGNMIRFIYKELNLLSDKPEIKPEEEVEVEPSKGVEPLDPTTKATLDEIFGDV